MFATRADANIRYNDVSSAAGTAEIDVQVGNILMRPSGATPPSSVSAYKWRSAARASRKMLPRR